MANNLSCVLSPFYTGVYQVVNDPSFDSIISWSKSNKSFIIWNPKEFHSKILSRPGRIHCSNFTMFFYDLKFYGFKRAKGSQHLEFGNANFVRGQPELLPKMQRKAISKNCRRFEAKARAEKSADRLQYLRI